MFVPKILSVCIISMTVQLEKTMLEEGGNPETQNFHPKIIMTEIDSHFCEVELLVVGFFRAIHTRCLTTIFDDSRMSAAEGI